MLVNNNYSYLHLQKKCFIKNCHTVNYPRAYDYGTEIGINILLSIQKWQSSLMYIALRNGSISFLANRNFQQKR